MTAGEAPTEQIEREAYVYLDISDPLVAWLTYRGELVSAKRLSPNAVSFWTTGYLRGFASNEQAWRGEVALEALRRDKAPDAVSRLEAFYVFPDAESAEAATRHWGGAFDRDFLATVGIVSGSRTSTHDAEWITHSLGNDFDPNWMEAYLRGDPHGQNPIWETLVDGRAIVFGTELRQRAYEVVRAEWPKSLALLELSRIAPYVGSDLGVITALVATDGRGHVVNYCMNFVDGDDPGFLDRLAAYDGPKNTNDLNATSALVLPNLMDRSFHLTDADTGGSSTAP